MFLDGFQQRSGCTSFTHKDIGSLLECAKLQDPLRGYDDTLCCSRNIMCGRENYYPVGASLSNPWKWTCFVNCILQCVVHTVPLVLKLLKDDHIDACPLISENFEWGRHQDAHEFLRCLLDKLDEAPVPLSPPSEGSSSIVQQIFGGQLKSQLHCPECNHCSDRLEPFVDLNLEVTQMRSIMDALKSFTKIEVFENFTCDGCKSRVNMEKQFKVEQAPEVLVIQLKRFQNLGSDISKIQAMVEYQSELDLNPFMSSTEDNPQNYDLYGVVEHLGVPSNGHYICFIRPSESDWFLFDDSKVMKISKDRALESQAYLLFYVKQGSSPWFSTLLKRRKNSSSDSDEGSISCSSSDDDEQENDCSPKTPSWCKEDEISGSDDSPAGALVTSWLRSVGSNSDSIAEGKCITNNAIVQENAMKDEIMKLMKDKVINKLCRSGFVGSEIENVAADIFAEALDELHMAVALKTSKRECTMEMLDDDGDKTGAKKRRRDEHEAEAEGHRLGEISMAEQECGVGSKGEVQVQENVKLAGGQRKRWREIILPVVRRRSNGIVWDDWFGRGSD
uniref:Uncharacterized protein n=1 Tax=Avena sativa TaxID=4498 RepID=A0ACD5TMI5_AVESA